MKILTRAKSLCCDEYLISDSVMYKHNNLYLKVKGKWRECDETTRSLNFEDMLDSKGNKIFASLGKDGKGGDILDDGIFKRVCKYQIIKGVHGFGINLSNKTIIGIQE